jgi:hypothetical protein
MWIWIPDLLFSNWKKKTQASYLTPLGLCFVIWNMGLMSFILSNSHETMYVKCLNHSGTNIWYLIMNYFFSFPPSFLCWFCFSYKVSLCSLCWPGICDPSASASQVLGLQVCITTAGSFIMNYFLKITKKIDELFDLN